MTHTPPPAAPTTVSETPETDAIVRGYRPFAESPDAETAFDRMSCKARELERQRNALRQSVKPVATVEVGGLDFGPFYFAETAHGADTLSDGTHDLYAAPPPPAQAGDRVSVPRETLVKWESWARVRGNELRELTQTLNTSIITDGLADGMRATLSAAPSPQSEGWVPVGERLPEFDIPVIVIGKPYSNKGASIAFGVLKNESGWQMADASFGWLELEMEDYGRQDDEPLEPTHWMPLPAAPSDGEKRG